MCVCERGGVRAQPRDMLDMLQEKLSVAERMVRDMDDERKVRRQ